MKSIKFLEWLNQFARSENIDSLSDALEERYEYIRIIKEGNFHDYIDYEKSGISNTNDFINCMERIEKVATTDYKKVSLLKTDDTPNLKDDGWFYRQIKNSLNNAKERLSFNVYASPELIKDMDNIVDEDNGNNIYQYKVPSNYYYWMKRVDPMTMYFNSLNKELLEKIVSIASPYLRKEKAKEIIAIENPYGVKLPAGIWYNKEYSKKDVQLLFDNLSKYFPEFSDEIKERFDRKNRNKLSVGQVYTIKKFIDDFAKDIDKIDKQSIIEYITYRNASKNLQNLDKKLEDDKIKMEAFYSKWSNQR